MSENNQDGQQVAGRGNPARDFAKEEREAERLISEGRLTSRGLPIAALARSNSSNGAEVIAINDQLGSICNETKADGSSCSWPALGSSGYCFVHDPVEARKRDEARELRDREEARLFQNTMQWLRSFVVEQKFAAAELVAWSIGSEYGRQWYAEPQSWPGFSPAPTFTIGLRGKSPTAESDADSDPFVLAEISRVIETLTNEVSDHVLTNHEVLHRAEGELAAIWSIRDLSEGADHSFNQTIRRWAKGELTNEDAAPSLLRSYTGIIARAYLEHPRQEAIALLAQLYKSLPSYYDLETLPKAPGSQHRRSNKRAAPPWAPDTLFPMPNIQNHGTRNLALAIAGVTPWVQDQSGSAELIAVRDGQTVCRIDLTPGKEASEHELLSILGPRAIKTMVATSRLIYEKTNREPLNHGVTLTVGEVARAMGYEPGRDRKIDPETMQRIGADLRALSKIQTYAADGPYNRATKSRPSSWTAPLIIIGAIHLPQDGPDGMVLPYEFDVMLGRNWAEAFARTDILQVASSFMQLTEDNTIRLGWYYLTEFRYAMTKTKVGLTRSIPALCDAAGLAPGTAKNRSRFLDRLEGWHDELQAQGVIGFHRRSPGLDTNRMPSLIFSEAEYFVRPSQDILDAYSAPRRKARESHARRLPKLRD